MSNINKAAVLNPFTDLTANILDYVPRATTSEFGIVAIGSGINVDALGRIYLDTQEYSDRLAAIEAEAASTLATQKSEVAAAIAQVNLAQSQTITALTLEVSNLKTNLTDVITTTQTDLINRADQLAQNVTDITDQLALDKAAFTQEIQDALVYLENAESVASALRTPRKIQTVPFDGTQDINLPVFTSEIDGLVPKREGTTTTKYLREDGGWVVPPNTTYPALTQVVAETGTSTTSNTISAKILKDTILYHTPIVTNIAGNAGTATKLQTPRTIGGVSFDGTANINLAGVNTAGNQNTSGNAATATKLATARTINGVSFDGSENITLPLASTSVSGTVQLNNTLTSTATDHALTAAQGKALNDTKLAKTENAVSASKLQTSRTISLTGGVTGSVSFDGSANANIATIVTGLGVANGIATLDSSGKVPSTQLPAYVDDVLEYQNVAAFPATGETGKIYVETTGNTTYRWGGTGYVKITSGEVSSVAGKTGVVTLTKEDVGLSNVDNTADSIKNVATAAKLTTARTIGGISFDGSADISLPGVNTAGNQSTSGNAATATKLQTARAIGGIGFNGTANINLPGVNVAGNQNTSGNAGSATKLQTPRTINGVLFDGTQNISVPTVDIVGISNGGTGATTAAAARTNLGLGDAATRSVGTSAGNVMEVGAFGFGSSSRYAQHNPATQATVAELDTTQMYSFINTGIVSYGQGLGWSSVDRVHFILGGYLNTQLYHVVVADKNAATRSVGYHIIRTEQNTTVDANGFIKAASPIVELYADKIKLNDEAQQQNITFEKLGIGDYLIKNSSGFAQEGWYVEQPKDANGNRYHAVVYDTLENGDISVKTYEQKLEGTRIVADLEKPVDIKENRFISIRLNELPQDTTAPQNPNIVDNQGNPAPSKYHELEEGVWVISDENAAILEQERLAAMQPLKRRQFRLTLAMNGYDLNEIEALIDQIEDPLQRTIAQIEWQDATDFERTNPTLLMMTQMLGLTSEQVDSLWEYGLAL